MGIHFIAELNSINSTIRSCIYLFFSCLATGTDCTLEEPCDEVEADFEIVQTESGRYKTSFHVAR